MTYEVADEQKRNEKRSDEQYAIAVRKAAGRYETRKAYLGSLEKRSTGGDPNAVRRRRLAEIGESIEAEGESMPGGSK